MELSTIAKNELDGEDKEVVETIQYIVIRLGNELRILYRVIRVFGENNVFPVL